MANSEGTPIVERLIMAAELASELVGNDGGVLYREAAKTIRSQQEAIDLASAMMDTAEPMLSLLVNMVAKSGDVKAVANIQSLHSRMKSFRKSEVQGEVRE